MFRCQLCQCVVPAHTPSHRLVVQQRARQYPYRAKANIVRLKRKKGTKGKNPRKEFREDPGGKGREIVLEVTACPSCATRSGRHDRGTVGELIGPLVREVGQAVDQIDPDGQ